MNKVDLFVKTGEFVATVDILPFLPGLEPDVILWGSRFFMKNSEGKYLECFVYAVPPIIQPEN